MEVVIFTGRNESGTSGQNPKTLAILLTLHNGIRNLLFHLMEKPSILPVNVLAGRGVLISGKQSLIKMVNGVYR